MPARAHVRSTPHRCEDQCTPKVWSKVLLCWQSSPTKATNESKRLPAAGLKLQRSVHAHGPRPSTPFTMSSDLQFSGRWGFCMPLTKAPKDLVMQLTQHCEALLFHNARARGFAASGISLGCMTRRAKGATSTKRVQCTGDLDRAPSWHPSWGERGAGRGSKADNRKTVKACWWMASPPILATDQHQR